MSLGSKLFFSFLLALSLSAGAFAQSEVGLASINGTVTDPSGGIVQGAKVTAKSADTGMVRQTSTTDAGFYSVPALPVGEYTLTVEQAGFKTSVREGLHPSVGSAVTLNIALEVGTTTETVNVSSEAPVVETTKTQSSTAVSLRQIQELPVNGRNFLDFTLLTPGVVRDPTRSGDLSFGGQRGTSNSLLVDGSDSNNTFYGQSTGRAGTGRSPYSFSEDAVEEFQVSTNNYAAEIGRAGGGVINTITKSGTNSFHGDGFWFFRDKALNANSWDNNTLGRVKRAYHFNQFGGSVGGPIVKDKAFFFFSYDGQKNKTPNTVALGALPTDAVGLSALPSLQQYLTSYANSLNNNVYLGKADWSPTANQHLTFRYNANRFTGINYENTGATSALGHTGNSSVNTDNAGMIYSYAMGANKVLEGRFFYTRDYEPGAANSTAPETIISQNGATALSFGRNSFSPRAANIDTYQPTASLSWIKGAHSFKFGADVILQQIANFFPGNFGGSFTFTSFANYALNRPSSFTQAFAGPNTTGATVYPNVNEFAFFVQDSWRLSRQLTFNYGVRYDYFAYAQPPVLNSDPTLIAANLRTNSINRDGTNVGPRLGLAYSPSADNKTVLRAGYGLFYAVTPSIFTGTAFTQNGIQVQSFTYSAATTGIPVTYPNLLPGIPTSSRTPSLFIFAPDFKNPQVQQWNFQVERQLAGNLTLTLGYLGTKGSHLPRTRDINLFPAVAATAPIQGGGSFTYYRHPTLRPNTAYNRIWLADSGADSSYNAGFIQMSKRFSNFLQIQTSYTWSHSIDDNPDATAVVFNTDDGKIVQNNLQPNLDRGNSNADIRQRFIFSGFWNVNLVPKSANPVLQAIANGWGISTLASLQSGRPYTSTIGSTPDINNDGNTRDDRTPGESRTAWRGPNFLTDDVRVSRFFPLKGDRVRLQLIGEAFNVTNRVNFTSLRTTAYNFTGTTFVPLTNFLTPAPGSATADPRILQLAAKIFF